VAQLDIDLIIQERDQARAEVERLEALLDARRRAAKQDVVKLELLKDAAYLALECLTAPNPYLDPEKRLSTVVSRLEDALTVNGSCPLRFEIVSDKN
jgi:hypothetical protein